MTDSVISFLAIWGAVLGTIGTIVSIILAVREFRKDRHTVLIQMDYSKEDPFWQMSGITDETYLVLNVLNTGFRPVQIKAAYLTFSNGEKIENGRLRESALPQKLEESVSLNVYFPVSEIKKINGSKKTQIKFAFVMDGKGSKYKYHIPKLLIAEHLTL